MREKSGVRSFLTGGLVVELPYQEIQDGCDRDGGAEYV
jgi:hypothetical protein